MFEYSGACPWNRNQSDELERESENVPYDYNPDNADDAYDDWLRRSEAGYRAAPNRPYSTASYCIDNDWEPGDYAPLGLNMDVHSREGR